ncbi:purine-cytosine permease family protein [Saccharopolyspora sp. 5N708]|uniref:purine-cytosine permease family protein n=1 Tax=Saccharopolyspora sp. 5N708 TaxID=3457424 RepID=UPI003FD58A40
MIPKGADARREAAEDYALRKVPEHWKRPSLSFAMSLSGLTSSVFFLALGGQLALLFGFPSAMAAFGVATVLGWLGSAVIARVTAMTGLDLDLITRGSGFGFLGSAVTSLIYGMNWLMYAAIEAAYLGTALHAQWPVLPSWAWFLVCAFISVPICWYGFTQNDFVQRWLSPIFVIGLFWLLIAGIQHGTAEHSFSTPGFSMIGFAGALGALLPNVVIQVLGTGDFSRFIRKSEVKRAMVVGPFVVIAAVYLISFPIGATLALYTGSDNPGDYINGLLGMFGIIWVVATQLRINNMNYYSASLSLANFAARILHWVPGRRFWVLITGVVAFIGAVLHVEEHLVSVVSFMGIFCLAWLGVLIADICVIRPKRRSALHVEHRRGYLASWGFPALISLLVGAVLGATLSLGGIPTSESGALLGDVVALGVGFLGPILVEWLTGSRMRRLVRQPDPKWIDDHSRTDEEMEHDENMLPCGNCGERVMRQDLVTCPVTDSHVLCSVCCGAHRTCGERCKTESFVPSDDEIRRHLAVVAVTNGADSKGSEKPA